MKWEVFKISAFTSLASSSSGYDIGFITYAKYMRNKEFSSEKTAKSWLTVHQPKEFLLTFHNFPVAFFLLLFTAKTWKIFKDLPASSSYFQRRALWYVNNREQKKRLNDTRIFLDFSLEFKQWIYRIIMHRKKILCRFFCVGQWCISFTGHNN